MHKLQNEQVQTFTPVTGQYMEHTWLYIHLQQFAQHYMSTAT